MLQIERKREGNFDILMLHGEVDASNSVILDKEIQLLLETDSKSILIDGTNLDYISSAGLGVFISYLEDFTDKGISFSIYGLKNQVFEVFKILGLDQLIPIYEGKNEAFDGNYEL
jgi:anti-sigma B factor antagonist